MKLTEAIKELEALKDKNGDVDLMVGFPGNYAPIKRIGLVDRGMGEEDLFVNLEPDTTISIN